MIKLETGKCSSDTTFTQYVRKALIEKAKHVEKGTPKTKQETKRKRGKEREKENRMMT